MNSIKKIADYRLLDCETASIGSF